METPNRNKIRFYSVPPVLLFVEAFADFICMAGRVPNFFNETLTA